MKTDHSQHSKVAILAIGTEITDGQIVNRNSSWLSSRLVDLGFDVLEHRAVPDDHGVMMHALQSLANESSVLILTGGLGPTSDDFTRDCVAEFVDQPMEWHEPSWQRILERLASRAVPVTENQRQQCFYPKGSEVLVNPMGTANAFLVRTEKLIVVALPGPPHEVEAVWCNGLFEKLRAVAPGRSRTLTLLRTMGIGEGALAAQVEEIVDEVCARENCERPRIGYRAHIPYVEVKLWAEENQAKAVSMIADRVRTKFSEYLVNENHEDVADPFLDQIFAAGLTTTPIYLVDEVSQGLFFTRLAARLAERLSEQNAVHPTLPANANDLFQRGLTSIVGPFGHDMGAVGLKGRPQIHVSVNSNNELVCECGSEKQTWFLPKLMISFTSDRGRKWAVEKVLMHLGKSRIENRK